MLRPNGTILVCCVALATQLAFLAPVVADQFDKHGARVLSKLPAVGIHPRVLFTADELPRIKHRLDTTKFGKVFKKIVLTTVKRVKQQYADLATLEPKDITPDVIVQHIKPNEGRNIYWGVTSLYAVVHDDAELKRFMARVITTHSRILLASKRLYESGAQDPKYRLIDSLWKNNQFGVGQSWTIGAAGLAVSYDVLYNDMTEKQRSLVRAAIATATKGRAPYGTGLPVGFGSSNHYGYHGDLAVLLCAIEGEKGYDRRTYQNIRKILLDYWNAGYTQMGACREDGYGPNVGLRAGSRGLLALARRGENIFASPKYRNYLNYVAMEFQPFPKGAFVGGASGGPYQELYPTSVLVGRYMYPSNPAANFAYRHILGDNYGRRLRWQGHLDFMMFGGDWQGAKTRERMLRATGLPLTRFYPERGKLISRSDWSDKALQFSLDARPDAFLIGHDKVDRGHFTMASHGRVWAFSGDFHQFNNSDEHSLVHIDGRAQAWKAPSVRFRSHTHTPVATTGSVDLKYAYDWQWSPPWPSKGQKFSKEWEPERSDPRALGWTAKYAPDWLPRQLYGSKTGYANKLPAGNWLHRRQYNPVLRATRAIAAVRGHHPYVVVTDDIQKDKQEHTYSWYLQLPIDVELKQRNGSDFILGEVDDIVRDGPVVGSRRMLVRVLQADRTAGDLRGQVETYMAHVDKRRKTKTHGKRLILDVKSVTPNFKVMLFPFVVGEPLPTTSWETKGEKLSVRWDDQQDELVFVRNRDGYRIAVKQKTTRPTTK
ncbi:MAG: hypothetical protein ACFCD0_17735 [Gemmataceae bacterium]